MIFEEAGIDNKLLNRLRYPPPTICLPPSALGVELFRDFVCPYLDPMHLAQMRDRDRWWLSALMYAEPGFEAVLVTHLGSFRSHPSVGPPRSRPTYGLERYSYLNNLQEIINGPPLEQGILVSWLSMLGTESMLQPLISAGLKLDQRLSLVSSYLSTAAQARNLGSFQVLLAAGARTHDSNDALFAFNGLKRTPYDRLLIDGLLSATPLRFENLPCTIPYLTFYWLRKEGCPPDPYVARRLIDYYHASGSHPPHRREDYLASEVLDAVYHNNYDFLKFLIENKASLEKVYSWFSVFYLANDRPSALEIAVVFGLVPHLKLLLGAEEGYEDRVHHLKRALAAATTVLDLPQPRYGQMENVIPILLEDDMHMYELIRHALHEAGCCEDDDGKPFPDAETLLSSLGEIPDESPEQWKRRLRDEEERRKKLRAGIIMHDPRCRLRRLRRDSLQTGPDGNNSVTATSAKTNESNPPPARVRKGKVRLYLERVRATLRELSTPRGALNVLLVVVGVLLAMRAIAMYYLWELAVWIVSLPRPPRTTVQVVLVVLSSWLLWQSWLLLLRMCT